MCGKLNEVDPVTFAVLKNKLQAIVAEQTVTIKNVSGSPVVTEACDFSSGIFLPDGTAVVIGLQNLLHANSLSEVVKNVMGDCQENPGINEGDMFLVNDPWKGAVHQSDVAIVAPFFFKKELIAWSGAITHQLDVGGMERSSWCPKATDKYQEAPSIPPIKLVEGGRLRRDIWNMLLNFSRLPFLMGLDLKASIACSNVTQRRLIELIEHYGIETLKTVMVGLIRQAEEGLRAKLRQLPDGIFRGIDFLDHDGHDNKLYKIMLTLTKESDTLIFDLSGSSAQAPGFINCTTAGLIGGLLTPMLVILAYDLPWNGGLLKPIKIIAPKGIVCNAEPPAPVSGGTTSIVRILYNASSAALSRLVACSDKYRSEAKGITSGTFVVLNLAGQNQYGEPFGTMLLDSMAGGEGSYPFRDGVDGQGSLVIPMPQIANVETNESIAPILYLYRKLVPDSAGLGKYRGGHGSGVAFKIHDVDSLEIILEGHGAEVPNSTGLFGGMPGSCYFNKLVRQSDILERFRQSEIVSSIDELSGEKTDLGAKPGRLYLEPSSVLHYSWQGGGGWADFLEHAPELVLEDVMNGLCSIERAKEGWGVMIDLHTMQLDHHQTREIREQMRHERLKLAREVSLFPQLDATKAVKLMSIGGYLELIKVGDQTLIRCQCGYQFGPATQNFKNYAIKAIVSPRTAGPLVRLHRELEMRQYLCPSCGLLHSAEIARKEAPSLWEIELKI